MGQAADMELSQTQSSGRGGHADPKDSSRAGGAQEEL